MILQTGGRSSAATSTRSIPDCLASSKASAVGIAPSSSPANVTTRTGVMRICSLIRCVASIAEILSRKDSETQNGETYFYPEILPQSIICGAFGLKVHRARRPDEAAWERACGYCQPEPNSD